MHTGPGQRRQHPRRILRAWRFYPVCRVVLSLHHRPVLRHRVVRRQAAEESASAVGEAREIRWSEPSWRSAGFAGGPSRVGSRWGASDVAPRPGPGGPGFRMGSPGSYLPVRRPRTAAAGRQARRSSSVRPCLPCSICRSPSKNLAGVGTYDGTGTRLKRAGAARGPLRRARERRAVRWRLPRRAHRGRARCAEVIVDPRAPPGRLRGGDPPEWAPLRFVPNHRGFP